MKTYLDFAATTPLDERVFSKMQPYFFEKFGNPSSIHSFGQQSDSAIEEARESVAKNLNCLPKEIIFTSGGTESDNLALRGAAFAARKERGANHILITPVEHPAVTNTAKQLSELLGFELEYLPVDQHGLVHIDDVANRLRRDTALASVIYANNEIGTINPVSEIGELCREKNITFHTDAVQAGAYLSLDVQSLNVDLLSLGAHKFYGPKGVGVLYVRQDVPLIPSQTGGSQEFALRAGTHNVPYIVGLAEALKIAQFERSDRTTRLLPFRDQLIGRVLEDIPNAILSGHPLKRMPNHASFVFKGVDGNHLLMLLDIAGFACSSGSACKTGDPEPSDVLLAMGFSREWALGSLRVTLGVSTTLDDISRFVDLLPELVQRARK